MKVSVVTISYNQAAYLKRCLKSVLDQSYRDIEYIVVDGGSSDDSVAVIDQYRNRIDKIIVEKDDGAADALNKGFRLATGDLFAFLNSDDELTPNAIADLVKVALANPDFDVFSGHGLLVDADGRVLRRLFSDKFTLARSVVGGAYLVQPSTLFRRSAYQAAGGFNARNRSAWDAELWVDMSLSGARFRQVEGYFSLYRVHGESITASAAARTGSQKHLDVMFNKAFGRPPNSVDRFYAKMARVSRHLRNPRGFFERLFFGPISGRDDIGMSSE